MSRFSLVLGISLIAGTSILLTFAIVARKALRALATRRRAALRVDAQPLLVSITAGRRLPSGVSPRVIAEVERLALDALRTVRGEAAGELVAYLRGSGVVSTSLRRLTGRGRVRRARAAETLGALRAAEAVAPLITALGDRSEEVRHVAARALGKIGGVEAATALLSSLDGHRRLHAGQVSRALVAMGGPAIPAARAALGTSHPTAGYVAAQLLGHLEALEAVPELELAMVSDRPVDVRVEAARALGRIGAPSATPTLLAACATAEPEPLRAAAAAALGAVGDTSALAPLQALVEEPGYAVPHAAAHALVRLGFEGRAALVAHVAAGDAAAGHAAEALALGEIGADARRASAGRRGRT